MTYDNAEMPDTPRIPAEEIARSISAWLPSSVFEGAGVYETGPGVFEVALDPSGHTYRVTVTDTEI